MPRFSYKVHDPSGAASSGIIEASAVEEAAGTLQKRGWTILSLEPCAEVATLGQKIKLSLGVSSIGNRDLIDFANDLAMLIKTGVPLMKGLGLIAEGCSNPVFKEALQQTARDLASGRSLAQALALRPDVFPKFLCALVEAGEAAGSFVPVLKQYAAFLHRREAVGKKIKGAMTYPMITAAVGLAAMIFISIKVVPTFEAIFKSFHLKLSGITVAVVTFSLFLRQDWPALLMLGITLYFLLDYALVTQRGRMALSRFQLSLPVLKPFFESAVFEQLFSSFSVLLKSGVSIVRSLAILQEIFAENPVYYQALCAITDDVTRGKSLSEGFRRTALFPEMSISAVRMGEESGQMTEVMDHLAEYHGEHLDGFIQQLNTIIEPVMIIGVGGVVAVIMLSVFLPMLELANMKPM